MCRAAKEAGAPHHGYIDRKKTSFPHLCISVIPYPIGTKFVQSCPPARGDHFPNLKEIAQAISEIREAKI